MPGPRDITIYWPGPRDIAIYWPGPRDIAIYWPGPWTFPVVQKPWRWAHILVQKPQCARGMVTGQIDTCITFG